MANDSQITFAVIIDDFTLKMKKGTLDYLENYASRSKIDPSVFFREITIAARMIYNGSCFLDQDKAERCCKEVKKRREEVSNGPTIYAMIEGRIANKQMKRETINFLISKIIELDTEPHIFYRKIIIAANEFYEDEDYLTFKMAATCYEKVKKELEGK